MQILNALTSQKNIAPSTALKAKWEKIAIALAIIGALALAAGIVCLTQHFLAFHWNVSLMSVGSACLLGAILYKASQLFSTTHPTKPQAKNPVAPKAAAPSTVTRTYPLTLSKIVEVEFNSLGTLIIKKGRENTLTATLPTTEVNTFHITENVGNEDDDDDHCVTIGSSQVRGSFVLTLKDFNDLDWVGTEDGNITIESLNQSGEMHFCLSGKGDIQASGKCKKTDIAIEGAGSFKGQNLQSTEVTLEVEHAGPPIHIGTVSGFISGKITTNRSCHYQGTPTLKESIASNPNLIRSNP